MSSSRGSAGSVVIGRACSQATWPLRSIAHSQSTGRAKLPFDTQRVRCESGHLLVSQAGVRARRLGLHDRSVAGQREVIRRHSSAHERAAESRDGFYDHAVAPRRHRVGGEDYAGAAGVDHALHDHAHRSGSVDVSGAHRP